MPATFGFDAAEVVRGVWLGGEKAAADALALQERDIRRVLSVHEEPESLGIDESLSRYAVRVHDMPAEAAALGAELPKALSFVQGRRPMRRGRPCPLHVWPLSVCRCRHCVAHGSQRHGAKPSASSRASFSPSGDDPRPLM